MATIQSTRKITLDVSRQNERIINVKQGDQNSRKLNIEVFDDRNPVTIPIGATVVFSAKLFDGTYADSSGTVEADGTVTVDFSPAMLAVGGQAEADVQFIGTSNNRLSSLNFFYYVHKQAVPDDAVIETDQFSALVTALSEVADFATVKSEVHAARGTYPTVEERLDAVDGELYEQASDIAALGGRLTTAEQSIGTLDSGLTGALQRITDSEEAISGMQTDISGMQDDISDIVTTHATDKTSQATKDNAQDVQLSMLTQQLAEANKTIANMSDGRITVDGGYGDISALPKTAAVAAMNSILYGTTATNLVTNGDFSNGTTGWDGSLGTITANNKECTYTITTLGTSGRIEQNIAPIVGNKYYVKGYINPKYNNATWIRFGNAASGQIIPTANQWNLVSGIVEAETTELLRFYHRTHEQYAVGETFKYKEILAVDLTATGETTLTLAQLDAKYANYFNGTQSAQITCIEATGKNLFDGKLESGDISTTAGLNITEGTRARALNRIRTTATAHYITLPTGYRIPRMFFYSETGAFLSFTSYDSSGSAFTFTLPVGTAFIRITFRNPTNTTITASDIEAIKAGCIVSLGSTATPHEAFKLTEQYIEPYNLYRVPNNAACKIDTARNEYVPSVKRYVLTANDVTAMTPLTNIDMARFVVPSDAISFVNDGLMVDVPTRQRTLFANRDNAAEIGKYYLGAAGVNVIFAKGTTLAQAKTALAGTVIFYQMSATAVEANTVKNVVTGNILSRPNGTIQFSNKHSFTSMVVDGKLPTRTNYADIATVERLEKLNTDGTLTPLDVSLATIAADKRSISHPQLTNGDIARCKYAYTFGGVNGRKDVSYVTGASLVADSVTGKVYKVGKAIANGVMTDTMTEVV